MATAFRAPFWVPRPSDPPEWNRQFVPEWQNSGAIQLTTTQAQFFGQPGQAPTKNWTRPLIDVLDDPPVWDHPITEWLNSGAIQLTNTQAKFFGQNGQAPPFRPNFMQDDPPVWTVSSRALNRELMATVSPFANMRPSWWTNDETAAWTPAVEWLNSGAIQLTNTQAKFFGQPGQVKPWIIHWNWLIDDAAVGWEHSSHKALLVGLILSDQHLVKFDAVLRSDDTPPWSPTADNLNMATPVFQQALQQRPTALFRWNHYDDAPIWAPTTLHSGAIQLTTTQAAFYGQPGQVVPFRWNPTYDDSSLWSVSSVGLNRQLLASINPFANRRVQWASNDETGTWNWPPQNSQPIILTTTQAKFYGQAGQGYPFRPNFTQDDPPVWTWIGPAWNKNVLFQITAPLTHPLPTFYQDDAWVGTPRGANPNTRPAPAPFQHTPPTFYSEDAFWVGTPQPSRPSFFAALATKFYGQPGQVPPFRPNFTFDDQSFWYWTTQRSYSIALTTTQQRLYGQPGQVVPRFWAFNYDDHSVWRGLVAPALINYFVIVPPLPPANVVYSLTRVTMTYSNSVVGSATSISRLCEDGSRTVVS